MMFQCPVCGDRHRVNDYYDNKDYICMNTANRVKQRTFDDMTPTDILSRHNLLNTRSTKVSEARAATVLVGGPGYRRTADKIGTLPGKNY